MADAIVTTLLNTGVRVDELVRLTWPDVMLQPRSGKAFVKKGKGEKARMVPLNATVSIVGLGRAPGLKPLRPTRGPRNCRSHRGPPP